MVPATYRLSDGMSEQVHARFGQRPTGEVLLLLVDSGMDAITVDSPRRFGRAQSIPTGFAATS
jgi:hypothetical protein